MTGLWIVLGIIAVLAFMVIGMYNSLIKLRNAVKNAWAQIDVQLKRRHDLIPNLIETVKGYMVHERGTLESITKMRSQAMNATNMEDRVKAEGELSNMLGRLQIAVEAYPDLKANQNFLALQEELTSTENKISYARQSYNDQVLFYNNKKMTFPSNIIAGMFNFKDEVFFEIQDQAEKEVPKVSF
ncbi:MAG TPA: LemA family protein [Bacteroidales bacterium]|nr:LemA family protein [Bacteroidales bacterium]HPS26842.1 LemA family protein [Bacteroidales bacterium]